MAQFLFSPNGGRYRAQFKFGDDGALECGAPAPPLLFRGERCLHDVHQDVHQILAV